MQPQSFITTTLGPAGREAARRELSRLGLHDDAKAYGLIDRMRTQLESKNSYDAIEQAMNAGIELGDAYVVVAHLIDAHKAGGEK